MMNEGNLTGIQLTKETRDRLRERKLYKRESYEEIVKKLLEASVRQPSRAGRPKKAIPQPIVELSTEGQESALNEALDNDYKEA